MGRNLRGTFWRSPLNNIKFIILWPQIYVVCSVVQCFCFRFIHITYFIPSLKLYIFMITLADLFQLYLFLFYYISIFYTFANLKNHKKTSIINNQTKILKHITSEKILDWSLRWFFERDCSCESIRKGLWYESLSFYEPHN